MTIAIYSHWRALLSLTLQLIQLKSVARAISFDVHAIQRTRRCIVSHTLWCIVCLPAKFIAQDSLKRGVVMSQQAVMQDHS